MTERVGVPRQRQDMRSSCIRWLRVIIVYFKQNNKNNSCVSAGNVHQDKRVMM